MHVTQNSSKDIAENWDHQIPISKEHDLYKLLEASALENDRIGLNIESIYDGRFIESARGRELEKIGELVGTRRKNGEGDLKLRKRIRAEFAAQASDTTYEMFASAVLSILETDKNSVTIIKPPDSVDKVITLELDGGVIDDSPFTRTEISSLLDRTVSAGAKVNIVEKGTFAFAGNDDTLKGWNEGTWSSTIS